MLNIELAAFEFSNLLPKRSGLKKSVWLDDMAKHRSISRDYHRIKYGDPQSGFVSISFYKGASKEVIGRYKKSEFSDLNKLFEWVELNREALYKFYDNDDYDFEDFLKDMVKV